jgi:hypothetical protein
MGTEWQLIEKVSNKKNLRLHNICDLMVLFQYLSNILLQRTQTFSFFISARYDV